MAQCSDLKNELPLYSDGVLDADENAATERHLQQCPLCRQRLDEYKRVQVALRSAHVARAPESLLNSIRAAVATELGSGFPAPQFRLVETKRDWMAVWLVPSSVGGAATVLLALSMLWFILNSVTPNLLNERRPLDEASARPSVFVESRNISPNDYASSRMDVAGESPSVNPRGSIVELSRLLVSEGVKDDEVVVVADVYENGSASIAEIVEAPSDRRAVKEIVRAFDSDIAYAPFVPASLDQRSDRVRVVFKIQSVNVYAR